MAVRSCVAAAALAVATGRAAPAPAKDAPWPAGIVAPGVKPQVLGAGYGFCEGPAADADGNIYFSDGTKDRIHFYEPGKPVRVFVEGSTDANGMMFNGGGELCVCEGAAYRIVAFDVKTKKKRILAGQIDGLHFNEPNDLSVDAHDGFYFTDPNYGHRRQKTVMKEDVYYVSAAGEVTRVSTVCKKPNGILLTADGKLLYLADNGAGLIYRYCVVAPGKLADEKLWIRLGAGPDGMTLDENGNLYVACGPVGVKVYSPQGKSLGTIGGFYASNCVFGGKDFSTLFVTSADRFLAVPMNVRGIKPPCWKPR
jgi:gluconolactonase